MSERYISWRIFTAYFFQMHIRMVGSGRTNTDPSLKIDFEINFEKIMLDVKMYRLNVLVYIHRKNTSLSNFFVRRKHFFLNNRKFVCIRTNA